MTTDVSTNKLKINVLTRSQYDSSDKNSDELYFVEESETNTWLVAVTDVIPQSANINDRYYNSNTKLIYTWNGSAWSNGISPTQDDLYIDKTDNSTYAWDGTNLIQVGSTGGITTEDIDGTTITLNSSNKIQASGVVNQNSGSVYNWVGTKLEYNALQTIHEDWIYYITDDEYASGNMSLGNVFNRLNRAYGWTYRNTNGVGNVYSVGYNGGTIYSDAFSAKTLICSTEQYNRCNYMICNGKLYRSTVSGTTFTRTQIGSDTTWTYIGGSWNQNKTYAINNGNLYLLESNNATLKSSGGWQKVATYETRTLGIKNDELYLIADDGATLTPLDSSGVWSHVTGMANASTKTYLFGIKDGKLYSVNWEGVVTQISSDTTWQMAFAGNAEVGIGINAGKLYVFNSSSIILVNDTVTWSKCCGYSVNGSMALTNTGKLYKLSGSYNSPVLTQVGTDTTWTDISGYLTYAIGINNGNVYYNFSATPTQLTTIGGISKVYGIAYTNSAVVGGSFWTGSITEDVHTVYTIPSPNIGYHTYSDVNLSTVSTISAVNTNNNTITDGLYTYTRDSVADSIFESVSPDSKNQLVTMADILNAIKG